MFDEYLNPSTCVDLQVPAVIAPELDVSIVHTPMVEKSKLGEDPQGKAVDPTRYRKMIGSITTWEDLTTRFLAQIFPPGRTAKLHNDISMFNNIMENLYLKHGLISRTYSKKSLIMASTFGSKSKSFMTMSNPSQDEPLTNWPVISWLQTWIRIETQQLEEPEPILEDEFQELHLNLPVLEVLAHAPIYNAVFDKYVESLELGKNESAFVQGDVSTKMEDLSLFTLPCRLGDSKPFDTLADLGSCVNILPLYLFKNLNIGLLEETDHIFGLADETKSYPVGIVKDVEVHIEKLKLLNDFYVIDMKKDPETPLLIGRGFLVTGNAVIDCRMAKIAVGEGITRKDFLDCHLPEEWEIARDDKINPFKDVLIFRRMVKFLGAIPINLKSNMWESEDLIKNPINRDKPPKNKDGTWHAKIRVIDPDGGEFTEPYN
nr:hypothetical protein [Tanacetum cinerariifolium]